MITEFNTGTAQMGEQSINQRKDETAVERSFWMFGELGGFSNI